MEREYWSGSDITFWCLVDKKRTMALKKAISSIVKPNDVVLELGTGTGILAMFAVDAGAKKVYAVEVDKNLWHILENSFKDNGYSDKIKLIKGDARHIKIPEKVNVIVAEMIATGLIDEIQIPAMNNALKFLKSKGKVIPSRISNFIDLVYNKNLFYGHKLNTLRYEYCWHPELKSSSHTKKIMYKQVDFYKKNKDNVNAKLVLTINKSGKINGVRISNQTTLSKKEIFGSSEAYCMPLILPIKEHRVKKGDKFSLNLTYRMCKGLKTLKYSLTKLKE
jgi:predicted RNA methylase